MMLTYRRQRLPKLQKLHVTTTCAFKPVNHKPHPPIAHVFEKTRTNNSCWWITCSKYLSLSTGKALLYFLFLIATHRTLLIPLLLLVNTTCTCKRQFFYQQKCTSAYMQDWIVCLSTIFHLSYIHVHTLTRNSSKNRFD